MSGGKASRSFVIPRDKRAKRIRSVTCPNCESGRLRFLRGEIEKGHLIVYYQCRECKAIWRHDVSTNVMREWAKISLLAF